MARNLITLFLLFFLLSNPWRAFGADAPGGGMKSA